MTRAVGSITLALVTAACGGSSGTVCTPDDPAFWPAGCDVLACNATICDITCTPGMTCGELDCTSSPQCRIACNPGSTCEKIDCTDAKDCFVACEANATCDVTCVGSEGCVETCGEGSHCLLRCGATPQAQCQLEMCASVTDCGSGVFACNRACP